VYKLKRLNYAVPPPQKRLKTPGPAELIVPPAYCMTNPTTNKDRKTRKKTKDNNNDINSRYGNG